jgi:glutathione synthase/RimK-type ligase-like ATP-grasp enzyme
MGFEIPPTLVTNDAEQVRAFAASHGRAIVCKALYEGWVPSPAGDRVFWTTRLDVAVADEFGELGREPNLFQGLVDKSYDVRVTVIGGEAFAVGIDSQSSDAATAVDWRRGDADELDHWVEELPAALSDRCVAMVADYGLAFGAIDLARAADGRWVFFELNPNGQWAWLEQRTGPPLRSRLADLLLAQA